MTVRAPAVVVSACAVDASCPGEMVLANGLSIIRCTGSPPHGVYAEDLAVCTRCTEAQQSDRYTVARALRDEGWALIGGQLTCPEHLRVCSQCEESYDPGLVDGNGCGMCPDCHPTRCTPCLQDARDEHSFAADWEER